MGKYMMFLYWAGLGFWMIFEALRPYASLVAFLWVFATVAIIYVLFFLLTSRLPDDLDGDL